MELINYKLLLFKLSIIKVLMMIQCDITNLTAVHLCVCVCVCVCVRMYGKSRVKNFASLTFDVTEAVDWNS